MLPLHTAERVRKSVAGVTRCRFGHLELLACLNLLITCSHRGLDMVILDGSYESRLSQPIRISSSKAGKCDCMCVAV